MVSVGGQEYSIESKLTKVWDKIKDGKLAQYDEDRFYIVDGMEGAGKSLFTIQQAAYIDPTIIEDEDGKVLPRICFSPEEFLSAIRHTKSTKTHTRCIIFDEAFRGMSSKSALSGTNKQITQALMEARQNNLVVYIVSPSFYLLEFYPAVLRSRTLFHVVKMKNSRRRFVRIFNYNRKAKLYQAGVRKGWSYPIKTKLTTNFFEKYPGGKAFEDKYRKKKYDSFKDEGERVEEVLGKTDHIKRLVRKKADEGLTHQQISDFCNELGIEIKRSRVTQLLKGYKPQIIIKNEHSRVILPEDNGKLEEIEPLITE